MIVIRYVDIIIPYVNEQGMREDEVLRRDMTLPVCLDPSRVAGISPYFSRTGRLFKNVSMISYDGDQYKVVGNYKKLDDMVRNRNSKFIGFHGKQKEKKIEERT